MPVLLVCRVCKRQSVSSDRVLSDVCEECGKKTRRLITESWEAGHGAKEDTIDVTRGSTNNDSRAFRQNGSIKPGTYGLGSKISAVTKALGIPECSSCAKRRDALNSVNMQGAAMEVFRGLVESVINPEKVLENEKDFVEAKARGAK